MAALECRPVAVAATLRDLIPYALPNGIEAIVSLINGNINDHYQLLYSGTIYVTKRSGGYVMEPTFIIFSLPNFYNFVIVLGIFCDLIQVRRPFSGNMLLYTIYMFIYIYAFFFGKHRRYKEDFIDNEKRNYT